MTQEIESHDYTDWGNIVSCKITTKSDGITRFMTVYNAQDKKIHYWISDWTLLDDNTWQSAAREVDADGKPYNQAGKIFIEGFVKFQIQLF